METEKITPKLTNLERLKQILNSENEEEEPQENQEYDYEDLDLVYRTRLTRKSKNLYITIIPTTIIPI